MTRNFLEDTSNAVMYPAAGATDLQSALGSAVLPSFWKPFGGFLVIIRLYKQDKLICQMVLLLDGSITRTGCHCTHHEDTRMSGGITPIILKLPIRWR